MIEDIIKKIDAAQKIIDDYSDKIYEYVSDKKFPIKNRFKIWEKYCNKIHYDFLYKSNYDDDYIRKFIDDQMLHMHEKRYDTFDYKFFLDNVKEAFEDEDNEYETFVKIREIVPSLNDFKEYLIETNFGSFVYDW